MKKIVALLLVLVLFPSMMTFAEGNEAIVICDLDDFKIVAEKVPVAAPHGVAYMHTNFGVIDKQGNVVVEQKYQEILAPTEGRAAFNLDGNIGFFDENWNIVIEPKYKNNHYPSKTYFSEGFAAVGKSHPEKFIVWGYIDRDGNEITDFVYDIAEPFSNGVAEVGFNYNSQIKYGKIDKAGNVVEPFKFGYATGKAYEYFWNEPIEVQLSQNLVELNGIRYKNSDIEYPFINYLGFSYIPLTYHGTRKLGINCDWTAETGVVLSNGGQASGDIIGDNGMVEGVLEKATFYKGKLTINGNTYEYGDTSYPLIHYKDVVYMPVLWEEGMKALGIEYTFINADKIENSDRGCMVFKTK